MDLINRLKYYMDSIGAPISQFADNCGIPRPSMSQLLNGRNKRISDDVINKIHNAYPDLSILWLMFGEGEMMRVKNIEISEPENDVNLVQTENQHPINEDYTTPKSRILPFSENTSDIPFADNSLFETPSTAPANPTTQPPIPAQKDNITFGAQSAPGTHHPNDVTRTVAYPSVNITVDNAKRGDTGKPSLDDAAAKNESTTQRKVSITPDSGKKITNIVVFYSDNSFQSFVPDA